MCMCVIFECFSIILFYIDLIKMYQIISEVNNTVNLQQHIDNRDGIKRVGLRSFTYTLGWYNVIDELIQKKKKKQSH